MSTAYIFCPSNILNKEKIEIPVSSNHANHADYTDCKDNGNVCIYIAADSGIATAIKLNITPNVLIGDFDSADLPGLKQKYKTCEDLKIIEYPSEKDDTDLMLAVKYSLENGYKNINIIGGLDGRIDHTLVNLFYLKYIKNHGGTGYITDGHNKISYLANSTVKIQKKFKYISIIPISPEIRGVTLINFKYPLNGATVRFEEPYTVCNEISNDFEYGEIIISNGEALICECDDFKYML